MGETEEQRRYRRDALALGEIGAHWAKSEMPRVEVRLPRVLAEKAATAWEQDPNGEGPLGPEDFEQRLQRHRAATLSLIGLFVVSYGRWDGDELVVKLSADLFGLAVDASDHPTSRDT